MIYCTIFFGIAIILLIYMTVNLLLKVEKLEDISVSQKTFIDELKAVISISNDRLTEIDAKGTFEADDEIGWFFKNLKEIQSDLNNFK